MPRNAPFKVIALGELFRQLRYAPARTRQRQMDAAERLVDEIDPALNYPEDFVVFRITGYRPDRGAGTMLVGEALLPDLVNFVLRISRDLNLKPDHAGRSARSLQQVSEKLNVGMKTLQRYRKQGLVCHEVRWTDGQKRIGCFDDALERFKARQPDALDRASEFSRMTPEMQREIIAHARHLHEQENRSLSETARLLAERYGRAPETLRLLLQRYERDAEQPIFGLAGKVRDHEARLIYRAWRRGVNVSALADRFSKTPTTIHRVVNRQRAELLRTLDLSYVPLPTLALEDAETVILSHQAVTSNLDQVPGGGDALALIAAAREKHPVDEDDVHAMIAALNALKRRAAQTLDHAGPWPASHILDAIETDLRWAGRLKRRVTWMAFPAALRSVEQHLHRALDHQPGDVILSSIETAISTCAAVVDIVDPSRGQRLDRRCSQAVDRQLASGEASDRHGRASAKHRDGSVLLHDPFKSVIAWPWLELPTACARALQSLERNRARIISLRYGLDGTPPRTIQHIAAQLKQSTTSIARLLRQSERELRAAATKHAAV